MIANRVVPFRQKGQVVPATGVKPKKPPVDPMLAHVLDAIGDMSSSVIAERSGLARSTIENWKAGRTRHPQAISLQFALRAAGFKLKIVRE